MEGCVLFDLTKRQYHKRFAYGAGANHAFFPKLPLPAITRVRLSHLEGQFTSHLCEVHVKLSLSCRFPVLRFGIITLFMSFHCELETPTLLLENINKSCPPIFFSF
jgi:hypothetical protein